MALTPAGMSAPNPLADDLNLVLKHTGPLWPELRGQRIFITGGTGFFGCWLLESFARANDQLQLGAQAVVLTRHPEAFVEKAPHLAAHPAIRLHAGDVRNFEFPAGQFSHVIHAATEASARLNKENPLLMFDTILEGTRRTLEFCRHAGVKSVLLASSGAVYGRQPADLTRIPEEYAGAPDPTQPQWAYGGGKRAAELLCTLYASHHGLRPKIARGFAFVGPYLPLAAHFAIGNFIRDALQGGPIRVNGDGTPIRSYLYGADLAVWLWTILLRGQPGRAYNVGSDQAISIRETAETIAANFDPPVPVRIAHNPVGGQPPERYVPGTVRAKQELALQELVPLQTAISRTIQWHQTRPKEQA
jgi:nucleoside-diphosphate-sugar epimerase